MHMLEVHWGRSQQELTGVEVGDAEVLEVVGVAGERRRRSGKE